jgi:hypothetical protein
MRKQYCNRLRHDGTQTKHTYHLSQCGGDVYALTWGVATPQAMIWAKVAGHHGVLATKTGPALRDYYNTKRIYPRSTVQVYVRYLNPTPPTVAGLKIGKLIHR